MLQLKLRLRWLVPVVIAALAMTVAVETAVLGVVVSKSGKAVTAVKAVTETTLATTTSAEWVNIPGMTTTINVPASQRALLIITFSAETVCYAEQFQRSGACYVRVLVDGTPSTPSQVIFDGTWENYTEGAIDFQAAAEVNSMQFVTGPLISGTHTVTVQWLVADLATDTFFRMQERTLTILRSKV